MFKYCLFLLVPSFCLATEINLTCDVSGKSVLEARNVNTPIDSRDLPKTKVSVTVEDRTDTLSVSVDSSIPEMDIFAASKPGDSKSDHLSNDSVILLNQDNGKREINVALNRVTGFLSVHVYRYEVDPTFTMDYGGFCEKVHGKKF